MATESHALTTTDDRVNDGIVFEKIEDDRHAHLTRGRELRRLAKGDAREHELESLSSGSESGLESQVAARLSRFETLEGEGSYSCSR